MEVAALLYQVSLEVFEGPLDLLLRLIEKQELDITKVSLAIVADQYLAHIAELQRISASNLADFLVIAAKMVLLKSRSLLPPPESDADEEEQEDIGEELARQLQEYKRYKDAASKLRELEETGQRAYPRAAPAPHLEARLEPGSVSLEELVQALKRVLDSHPRLPPVDDVVSAIVVRISDCIKAISELVQRHTHIAFSACMQSARSRLEIIVTFLALLELIKQQRVRATQEQPFGEIYLEARTPDPDAEIEFDLSEYGEADES